jgi:hypothetical protein
MALTPEELQYYEDLDETFGTPGWKRLCEDWANEIYQLQADALDIKGPDAHGRTISEQQQYLKGAAEHRAILLRLQELSIFTRAQHEAEDEDELDSD